jgi:hypothetical protein
MLKLLLISDKPSEDGSLNTGNAVTNDLKVLVKMNRLVGIHVTPTVVFNGVVENGISSSFTSEQWEEVSVSYVPEILHLGLAILRLWVSPQGSCRLHSLKFLTIYLNVIKC